jgi:hypothetical protein
MSVYRCDGCGQCKDADFDGCEQHPTDNSKCLCDDCHMYSDPDFACFRCNQADKHTKYCKVTDQYYHDKCI